MMQQRSTEQRSAAVDFDQNVSKPVTVSSLFNCCQMLNQVIEVFPGTCIIVNSLLSMLSKSVTFSDF